MYTKKKRVSVLLICIAFIIVTFFSIFFIVKEANHDCTGESCPICSCIQQAVQTLKNLGTRTGDGENLLFIQLSAVFMISCTFLIVPCTSLISQKVRMNN